MDSYGVGAVLLNFKMKKQSWTWKSLSLTQPFEESMKKETRKSPLLTTFFEKNNNFLRIIVGCGF